jgi:acyl-CoA thioester hydrolase
MPRFFLARLAIPADRVGVFGEVAASAYASLLQEAATAASTDAGYSPEWYLREETIWVIRRSTLELVEPVPAGADVEVSTWVADFRRVRSRREYEIRLPPSSKPCLKAHTDWVYIERESSRPRRVPSEMMSAFVPEGAPPALPREPLAMSPPPPSAFESRRTVGRADLDALAHVNNARYFDYLEESAAAALAARGWGPARIAEAGGLLRARRQDIEYLGEARLGEELRCLTWGVGVGADRFELATEIRRRADDACLTRARAVWRWFDRRSGRPRELSSEFRAALSPSRTPARSVW